MPALESDLRRQLENVIIQARDEAEGAARSALQKRAVNVAEPFSHFDPKERELRNRLRARGRQVGDVRNDCKAQSIDQLTQELAYEFWHRMLFARFLAENHLLMHPDGVAVSLEECEELAKDASPPAPNGFVLAARYASTMLPQIFRTDDVLLEIDFAPEKRLALEKLLGSLPSKTFLADDSLGWAYQFWQSKKKDEINKTGEKIDGRTLSAVTQLFTEHYMVQFLLHNTIGAWWSRRHNIQGPVGGAGVPAGQSPVEMEYLRWRDDGTPAAGKFEGWPKSLAEFKMLDPCCGSGHFLGAGFNLLVPLRMYDEGLTAEKACEAVLRDNLFGLELDPRCTQIAAFALALAAWKYPDAGGYRPLPSLNIACSGQGVTSERIDWVKLANGNRNLSITLGNLYDLFQKAPHLGSLTDPRSVLGGESITGSFAQIQPLLATAMTKYGGDVELNAVGIAAQGIAKAAELLNAKYTLVITNVPYLGRGKQNEVMTKYVEEHYKEGKADLATAFVLRCLDLCKLGCTAAMVTPQNWLFLTTYTKLREKLLKERTWNLFARLGPNAFQDMNWWAATTALLTITAERPSELWEMSSIDVSMDKAQHIKASRLANRVPTPVQVIRQVDQLRNPDARIVTDVVGQTELLRECADSYWGIGTGDIPRFIRCCWEIKFQYPWARLQTNFVDTLPYTGRDQVIQMLNETNLTKMPRHDVELRQLNRWSRGSEGWGKKGVAVQLMNKLVVSLYTGEVFQNGVAVIIPRSEGILAAIWCFCKSPQFLESIRKLDQKVSVTNHTLLKVPFDPAHWQTVAVDKYPNGLPEPYSDDPTQWLFQGEIASSSDPLQVAVARLLGYRWPEQPKTADAIDRLTENDGIVCLPSVRGKADASERLLEVLHAAYGTNWSDSVLHTLLTDTGCKVGTTLDDWLRNQFFDQHCKRFHQRPFIWHIWDGRKDGFSALVNYHKLDHQALENLTYAYLGDWITAQGKSDKAGADSRLGAAQELQAKLKLILAGAPPYDIFVRWKPLHEQAIGWQPDLNDGVRMNIRPFIEADTLRKSPNIKWTKDRDKEPERDKADYPWFCSGNEFIGDRVNDVHLANEKKTAAQSRKKGAK
jgi:hypothetical protein